MTAADLIRVCLELDRQCLTSRPSPWGQAAELVAALCERAEVAHFDPKLLGDYRSIDLLPARANRVTGELDQPTVGLIEEVERLRGLVARLVAIEPMEWRGEDDEGDLCDPYCLFCGEWLKGIKGYEDPARHKPDCPWVAGRAIG